MRARAFEVVVNGTLSTPFASAIEVAQGFKVDHVESGETHFIGWVPDQARLYALFDMFQRLTIELISVNPVIVGLAAKSSVNGNPRAPSTCTSSRIPPLPD